MNLTHFLHGDVLWSPMHEARWTQERRLPDEGKVRTLSVLIDDASKK